MIHALLDLEQRPFVCDSLRVPFDTQPSSLAYQGEEAQLYAPAAALYCRGYQAEIHPTAPPSESY
jgi:hypothetical protein